jgi:hypothetical protein
LSSLSSSTPLLFSDSLILIITTDTVKWGDGVFLSPTPPS